MRRQNLTCPFVLLLAIFISSGCEKAHSDIDALTNTAWKLATIDANPSSNPSGEVVYYPVTVCASDDMYYFSSDGKLTINHGANPCAENEKKEVVVNYFYNKRDHTLTIDDEIYTIIEITDTQIKYYKSIPGTNGFAYLIYILQ